ncbi:MAG: formate dehydrogenase [Aquabacterium sp.]|nr:formate dehydrogenase [Aquabacterium sp.]
MSKSPVTSPAAVSPLSRRRLFAGAGTAGALAAVATVLPSQREAVPEASAQPKAAPEAGGGYQLTAHVKQYYQTTKV